MILVKKKKSVSDICSTYRGNHLACSTQGSSPDSQQRRPPSQQKHLTSSLRPGRGWKHQVKSRRSFWGVSERGNFRISQITEKTKLIFCCKIWETPSSQIKTDFQNKTPKKSHMIKKESIEKTGCSPATPVSTTGGTAALADVYVSGNCLLMYISVIVGHIYCHLD